MTRLNQGSTLLLLAILSLPSAIHAQPAHFDIDLKDLDRPKAAPPAPPAPAAKPERAEKVEKGEKKKQRKPKKVEEAKSTRVRHAALESGDYRVYTVKPGDHIFKILMGKFGMSNERAERMIPEIVRINKISNIRNLQVGSKLLIPRGGHEHPARITKCKPTRKAGEPAEAAAMLAAAARLEAQGAAVSPMAPTPAPMAPMAPMAPAPAAPPVAPAAPVPHSPTWICPVTEKDPGSVVDSILNALSITWCRNRIVQSEEKASIAFSIRVDRYFEYKGGRYIVSIGEGDAYSETLMKLLQNSGYHVLKVGAGEDFRSVTEKVLEFLGVVPQYGKQPLPGGSEAAGFLVQPDDAGGRRVILTRETVDPHRKWVMTKGCGIR